MVDNYYTKMINVRISMEVNHRVQTQDLFIHDQSDGIYCGQEIIRTDVIDNDILCFDGNKLVEILISFSIGVASGVVANIIYNAIHGVAKKIEINGRRTRLSEDSITQAIETIKELLQERKENEVKACNKDMSHND